jgi:hypothetical protein
MRDSSVLTRMCVQDDFFLLSEMVHDYIGIVGAVKDVLAERIKAWQAWQGVQVTFLHILRNREQCWQSCGFIT